MIPPEELARLQAESDADFDPTLWLLDGSLPPGSYFDDNDEIIYDPEECF